ncbi:aspartate-semialdehyde dehydrogenase [Synoicihabitans lomoniglobus]|uniref:Aspartate-semialdehyde dehydrogenase n=1 Tax=Synoicihabitans lomoniglobus TaxID=2909285 RepID=A0AAF0CRJ8_9BACT|nr:aspartate-semialdehyde dehydrogenase [Opitutaceae bacterium LMO-M01]WED66774.1 aspartate-semialdehyde dehydrogenase [Opitutaceae bacterium LMO-M01]
MSYVVGIVGATGAVGQELVRLMRERNFPLSQLRLLASSRSAGKTIQVGDEKIVVEEAKPGVFADIDVAFFAAGGGVTRALAQDAVAAGCLVIDKSSALRMRDDVPLVIPEINPEQLQSHGGIIANPNCSTAVMLMGLWPLHQTFGLKRIFVSTYQSVSGTGAEAIDELDAQVRASVAGEAITSRVYPHQIAYNCIPHVDTFGADGYTGEETKMAQESRKIMGLPDLKVSATCVRVPVLRAHSIAVSAEFERPVDLTAARAAVAAFAGAELIDDPANNRYPTPLECAEHVRCGVGRLRIDTALDNGISFWVSGDNLWKGAALNAVQNAELMIREGWLAAKAASAAV